VTRDHTGAPLGGVAPFTNPRLIGLGKSKLFEREALHWFSELDCWVDFKRRQRFVLAATFVSLCADVAAGSRIPGVWETYGSPLDPSEWKSILGDRRSQEAGKAGGANAAAVSRVACSAMDWCRLLALSESTRTRRGLYRFSNHIDGSGYGLNHSTCWIGARPTRDSQLDSAEHFSKPPATRSPGSASRDRPLPQTTFSASWKPSVDWDEVRHIGKRIDYDDADLFMYYGSVGRRFSEQRRVVRNLCRVVRCVRRGNGAKAQESKRTSSINSKGGT
jgi:hypothetical protein